MSEGDRTLPPGWAWAHVGEVGRVQLGRQRSPEHHQGEHMRPYLRVANVFDDRIDTQDVMEMNFTPEEFEIYRLHEGDILLNEGQSRELVGRPAMFRGEVKDCCFTNSLIRYQVGPALDGTYALQQFRYWLWNGEFSTIANVTTNIAHLGAGRFAELRIAVPPVVEQRRIAAKLEDLLTRSRIAKDALEEVPSLLERYRQSVLAAAFRGELTAEWRARLENDQAVAGKDRLGVNAISHRSIVPSSVDLGEELFDNDSELPAGWSWRRLGDLGRNGEDSVQTGPFGAQLHSSEFVESGVPVVAVGNLTGMGFTREGLYYVTKTKADSLSRYDVQAGDVLFARSGATLGKVCVAPDYVKDWRMTGHILRMRLQGVEPQLVVYALAGCSAVVRQVASGIRGMTRPGYNTGLLENIRVPVPPIQEQYEILKAVDLCFSRIDLLEENLGLKLGLHRHLETSLLARAFRGELVPQDSKDEPASVLLDRIRKERAAMPPRGPRSPRKTTAAVHATSAAPDVAIPASYWPAHVAAQGTAGIRVDSLYKASRLTADEFYRELREHLTAARLREDRRGHDVWIVAP